MQGLEWQASWPTAIEVDVAEVVDEGLDVLLVIIVVVLVDNGTPMLFVEEVPMVGVWHVAPVNPLPHEQLNAFGNCWACAQMFVKQADAKV